MRHSSILWVAILSIASINAGVLAEEADYRLPKTIVPEQYTLKIFTVLDDSFEFRGNVQIKVSTYHRGPSFGSAIRNSNRSS